MTPFDDALRTVLDSTRPLDPARIPLHEALGMALAEDVASDVDMPPFNKSAMDGFAIVAADLEETPRTLPVVQDIPAGAVPAGPIQAGQCARIMTGAPVPDGADTVVRVEDTQPGPSPDEAVFLKGFNVFGVDLPPVAVSFADFVFTVQPAGDGLLLDDARVGAEPHGTALFHDILLK